jgi:hypothetical protein
MPWSVISGLVSVEFSCLYADGNELPSVLVCCAVVLICWLVLCSLEMAGGRDDAAIAQALASMAQVLAQAIEQAAVGHHDPGEAEEWRLDRFMRNSPLTFKGRYD